MKAHCPRQAGTYGVDGDTDRRRLGAKPSLQLWRRVRAVVRTKVLFASERATSPSCRAIYSWPNATWCGLSHGLDGCNRLPSCDASRDRGAGADGETTTGTDQALPRGERISSPLDLLLNPAQNVPGSVVLMPLVVSVTTTSVNATVIGGLQGGWNTAVNVRLKLALPFWTGNCPAAETDSLLFAFG